MRTYLTLFILSLLVALTLTPLVRRHAPAWGGLDVPGEQRRIHRQPIPRLGGVGIFIAFVLVMGLVPLLNNLIGASFRANWRDFVALLAPATLILLLGIYDDLRGANAPLKLTVQLLAAVILFACGFRIERLSTPFGGAWELSVWLSLPLTALWVVGITNAFNLIDGIDGLAAGASIFAQLTLFLCLFMQGHPEIGLMSVVLAGATLGFLRYNFNPATIFLGDSGSLFLGFMAAALALAGAQKGTTLVAIAIPLVSFGLPITEITLSLVRRFLGGDPLFQGDRRHIHHRLLDHGLTQRQAAILLYGICALFSLFGLMLVNPQRNLTAFVFFVLGVVIMLGVQHLRYPEFREFGSLLRREWSRSRHHLSAGIRFRRAAAAADREQLLAALIELFDSHRFDAAVLELERTVWDGDEAETPPAGESQPPWVWQWERPGVRLAEAAHSPLFWSLRMPLAGAAGQAVGAVTLYRRLSAPGSTVDIAQICELLSEELTATLTQMSRAEAPSVEVPSPFARPRRHHALPASSRDHLMSEFADLQAPIQSTRS